MNADGLFIVGCHATTAPLAVREKFP